MMARSSPERIHASTLSGLMPHMRATSGGVSLVRTTVTVRRLCADAGSLDCKAGSEAGESCPLTLGKESAKADQFAASDRSLPRPFRASPAKSHLTSFREGREVGGCQGNPLLLTLPCIAPRIQPPYREALPGGGRGRRKVLLPQRASHRSP